MKNNRSKAQATFDAFADFNSAPAAQQAPTPTQPTGDLFSSMSTPAPQTAAPPPGCYDSFALSHHMNHLMIIFRRWFRSSRSNVANAHNNNQSNATNDIDSFTISQSEFKSIRWHDVGQWKHRKS